MTRSPDPSVHHHRHRSLLDDNLQEIPHAQTLVRPDRSRQRHHRSRPRLLEMLTQRRISLTIRQHHEAHLHQPLRSPQRLHRVRQEITRIRVNLQFQPISPKRLPRHLSSKHSLLSISHPRSIRQQLNIAKLSDMPQQIIISIVQFHTLHSHRHHLRPTRLDSLSHQSITIEFSRSQEQPRAKLTSSNYKFRHIF